MGNPIDRGGKIFSEDLIAKALRDSGYKNTAYALAELIDNSIQADANEVEVICIENRPIVNGRTLRRIDEIAVVDNGHGMDSVVLRAALMFGNGTHLNDRSGIGRFGMGLPNATFSQAKRVDIWSWQNGSTNALWTYLDLEEILKGKLKLVPEPVLEPLPSEWYSSIQHTLGNTGTLVLWSKMDENRLTWKTAKTTLQHTEEIVGRVYRKYIHKDAVSIRLATRKDDSTSDERYVKINDPLYILTPSSTPEPFGTEPMFQKWGDTDEVFIVSIDGEEHKIYVRFSFARPETVQPDVKDRGHTNFGKHAAKNIGVSLVRANRELEIDSNWAIGYDPTERWWGCEVEFPAALDEIFGVTINKQAATQWSQFAQMEWLSLAEDSETRSSEVVERLKNEGDFRGVLLDIAEYIRKQLKQIREALKDQTKGRRTPGARHSAPTAADIATKKIKRRSEEHPIDQDEEEFSEQDADELKDDLVTSKNYSDEVAEDIVRVVWERKQKIIFLESKLDGNAFFKVEDKPGGLSQVIINRNHPFFSKLYETLEPAEEIAHMQSPDERLQTAVETLKLMFAAWARYEQESSEKERTRLDDVRQDWGRMARFFLEDNDEE